MFFTIELSLNARRSPVMRPLLSCVGFGCVPPSASPHLSWGSARLGTSVFSLNARASPMTSPMPSALSCVGLQLGWAPLSFSLALTRALPCTAICFALHSYCHLSIFPLAQGFGKLGSACPTSSHKALLSWVQTFFQRAGLPRHRWRPLAYLEVLLIVSLGPACEVN